jgi:eukaryotic-like serine/threonine-protein kinase
MAHSTSCPDSAELKELLDGTLPEKEQAELNSHLETCPFCQHSLEGLVAGKESWSGAAQQLSQNEQRPEAGLERVMEEIKNEGQSRQTEADSPPGDEIPLDFLSPPENPEHLGRLGHYDVVEVIGRGGMGVVLKAFDSALHRIVAIKVLTPQLATSPDARKRFEREARAAAAISHEHIVAIYAVEETNGLPYLVMEYVAGVSLQERLDRTGSLELKEILRIGMQAARGLAAAHAQGLVHRDIKPANILLHNGVERVKITDFGLARAVDDASLTQIGFVAGTPQYMAPEQARGEPVDHRADLFSLGSVLYAMCTGRPPFRASTTMAVLKRVSEESPQPVAQINPEIPLWLVEIIDKLHAKSPAERFQSAQEVAELLGAHLARLQQPGVASVERVPNGPSRSALYAPRFRRLKAAALFLPLIACGLVLAEATGFTKIKELVATVLRISTSEGTLIVEIDDPQVRVTIDGEEIAIHGAGPQEIRVKPGEHRIQAMKDGKPVPVDKDLVTINRGGKQIVRVRQEIAKQEVARPGQPASEVLQIGAPLGPLGQISDVRSLAFSPDGQRLVITSADLGPGNQRGEIRLWDVRRSTGKQDLILQSTGMQHLHLKSAVLSAVFSPGGQILATAEGDGTAQLRDPATWQVLIALGGDVKPMRSVAFAPDGETLATGSQNNVRIWRLLTRELSVTLATANAASCVTFSPDGKTLAVGGYDFQKGDGSGNVKLFEVGSWRLRATLDVPPKVSVWSVAFSPDSKMLATANSDETVKLWDAANGQLLETLHTDRIHCAVFSPDGRLLATGGDKAVKLWDVANREELIAFQGIGWLRVGSVAFSPDGKVLASGSADRFVRLWDVAAAVATAKTGVKVTLVPVMHSDAKKLAESVRKLLGDAESGVTIEVHPELNSLVIRANAEQTKRIKEMVSKLDVRSPAQSQGGDTEGRAKLRAMLQERLATLRENAAGKENLFQDGRIPIGDFDEAKLLVLNAELDLAESDKERIGILERIVTLSREVEKAIDQLYQMGRVTRPDFLDARDKRLKAEIALERAKGKATTAEPQLPEARVVHPTQIQAAPSQQFTGRLTAPQGDPIGITFNLDERSFLEYQRLMRQHKGYGPGSPLYIGLPNEEGFQHEGRLVRFDDQFNTKTRTVQAQGSMPNPDRLLLPGMFVRVRMPFGPPQKFLEVPSEAVLTEPNESYVLVVNDKDIVDRRPVKAGPPVVNDKDVNGKDIVEPSGFGRTRIIEKGLAPADWVVVGTNKGFLIPYAAPGTHVKRRIVDEKAPAPP